MLVWTNFKIFIRNPYIFSVTLKLRERKSNQLMIRVCNIINYEWTFTKVLVFETKHEHCYFCLTSNSNYPALTPPFPLSNKGRQVQFFPPCSRQILNPTLSIRRSGVPLTLSFLSFLMYSRQVPQDPGGSLSQTSPCNRGCFVKIHVRWTITKVMRRIEVALFILNSFFQFQGFFNHLNFSQGS